MTKLKFTDSSKQALFTLAVKNPSIYLTSPFKMDLLSGLKDSEQNIYSDINDIMASFSSLHNL